MTYRDYYVWQLEQQRREAEGAMKPALELWTCHICHYIWAGDCATRVAHIKNCRALKNKELNDFEAKAEAVTWSE